MQDIQYIGENLLPGSLGHFLIILAFSAALLSSYSFFQANSRSGDESTSWKKIGRISFLVHGFSIFTVIGLIFYLMLNERYEYQYVWAHVNSELPKRYIFSAFWEGQEGSFLLWMFWHVILGFVIIYKNNSWEKPVIGILSLVQVFIVTMIMGVYFNIGTHGLKFGSNPFMLLRETMDAPIFSNPDYLKLIKGKGLNPLLQNYWMTIHPPTLFLGFASTVIPFCFALAALINKQYTAWLKPVLPWALFSAAILGLGILMGAAWAYEALSFGGYWAWDPVENMSLVPWLIMVAAIHSNVVSNATGYSNKTTYVLYVLSFIGILYSTFLTRSGVLGDTSVHAFTEMGLEWQLIIFMSFFSLWAIYLYARNTKNIPTPKEEEKINSKEFWMFIGTLVLMFSSILISFTTSIPVFNKLFDLFGSLIGQDLKYLHRTSPTDAVAHYNKYQLWIGVLIGIFSGIAQFFRYSGTNWKNTVPKFLRSIAISSVLSVIFTWLTTYWIQLFSWQYYLLLGLGYFTIFANIDYFIFYIRNNLKIAGSVFSHVGFGLLIIGIIASGLNKRHISVNKFALDGILSDDKLGKNIVLIKGLPMIMNDFKVTYVSDTMYNHTKEFNINYSRLDKKGKVVESFNISPYILYTNDFSKLASTNPSTKRYLGMDIFSVVSNLPKEEVEPEAAKQKEDSLKYRLYAIGLQDTVVTDKNIITVAGIIKNPTIKHFELKSGDLPLGVKLNVYNKKENQNYTETASIILRDKFVYDFPAVFNAAGTKIKLKEDAIRSIFMDDEGIQFKPFSFKRGDKIDFEGLSIGFRDFNKNVKHPLYSPQEGDIAVSAIMVIESSGTKYTAEPLYLIRGGSPFNLKDVVNELGLHIRFTGIDPKTETVNLEIGKTPGKPKSFGIEVAENFERSDFIVLEAVLFPGINLVWGGSLLMLFGLAFSIFKRFKDQKTTIV
ncbi:MAG: cytochrome c biogenesis protein CcsA [Saprospiraceae bacterium]|nr:cytochrome c biogenesis protein CcsA [Saprospiraceae bacterium]